MATGEWSDGGNTFTTKYDRPRGRGRRGSGGGGGYEPPGVGWNADLVERVIRKKLLEALKRGPSASPSQSPLDRARLGPPRYTPASASASSRAMQQRYADLMSGRPTRGGL